MRKSFVTCWKSVLVIKQCLDGDMKVFDKTCGSINMKIILICNLLCYSCLYVVCARYDLYRLSNFHFHYPYLRSHPRLRTSSRDLRGLELLFYLSRNYFSSTTTIRQIHVNHIRIITSMPSSQPSTDPSSQPSMNPSISGIPSSQVSEVQILIMLYELKERGWLQQ